MSAALPDLELILRLLDQHGLALIIAAIVLYVILRGDFTFTFRSRRR